MEREVTRPLFVILTAVGCTESSFTVAKPGPTVPDPPFPVSSIE
jgi:hypothetical protein